MADGTVGGDDATGATIAEAIKAGCTWGKWVGNSIVEPSSGVLERLLESISWSAVPSWVIRGVFGVMVACLDVIAANSGANAAGFPGNGPPEGIPVSI